MSESYRRLLIEERDDISLQLAMGDSFRSIARQLGRSPSTISREYFRNASTVGCRAVTAQKRADNRCYRKPRKLPSMPRLRHYILRGLRKQWSP